MGGRRAPPSASSPRMLWAPLRLWRPTRDRGLPGWSCPRLQNASSPSTLCPAVCPGPHEGGSTLSLPRLPCSGSGLPGAGFWSCLSGCEGSPSPGAGALAHPRRCPHRWPCAHRGHVAMATPLPTQCPGRQPGVAGAVSRTC